MNVVALGITYFPDPTIGRPVYNGYIYVGVPDTDPTIEANQKAIKVRQESGAEIDVAQPVRTSPGGVPIYEGSPVQILTDGAHSIAVLNESGTQVYYLASSEVSFSAIATDYIEAPNIIHRVDTLSDAHALTGTNKVQTIYIEGRTTAGDGYQGTFTWLAGDQSAAVTADPQAGVTAYGAGDNTGASGAWVRQIDYLTPQMFGGTDSAAALAASTAAVAHDRDVVFAGSDYTFDETVALTSIHDGLTWNLKGVNIFKGFNGDLVTVTNVDRFSVIGAGRFDGQYGTYTGKGFVFSGASDYPRFGEEIIFFAIADTNIEFGADSGKRAKVPCLFLPGSGQGEVRAIHTNGPDTAVMQRDFSHIVTPGGYIDISGASNTTIGDANVARIENDSSTGIALITNVLWGNSGNPMTLSGTTMIVMGCRFSGDVTLASTFNGVFVGNQQTDGAFTNNSTGVNATVLHRPLNTGHYFIGRHKLNNFPTAGHQITRGFLSTMGDADASWSPTSSAPTLRVTANLTAQRTLTLSTTGAENGMELTVSRTASSGGFNLVIVNDPSPTLLQLPDKGWAKFVFDGTQWRFIAYGIGP